MRRGDRNKIVPLDSARGAKILRSESHINQKFYEQNQ